MEKFERPKLTQKTEEICLDLQTENGERGPQIKIHIFFGNHNNEQDAELLRVPFQKADAYIPEFAGWNPKFKNDLQNVARGLKTPEEMLQENHVSTTNLSFEFYKRELEIIFNSNKPVGFVDIPYGNRIGVELKDIILDNQEKREPSLEKLVEAVKAYFKHFSEKQSEREDFMVDNLEKVVKNFLIDYPELMKKKQINVLMSLGALHTRVFHILKRERRDVSREFDAMSKSYSYEGEAFRRYTFDKEVSDELVARVLLEEYISGSIIEYLYTVSQNNAKIQNYIRKIVERFSLEDIKQVVEADNPSVALFNALNQKKVYQVESEADIDSFIAEVWK